MRYRESEKDETTEEQANAAVIHDLYASAEAAAKNTPKFVSLFGDGGQDRNCSDQTQVFGI
jgi:hypothetical protein